MIDDTCRKPEAYGYLHRILTERLNAEPLQKANGFLSARVDLLRYELAEATVDIQAMVRDLEAARADTMSTKALLAEALDTQQQTVRDLTAARARIVFLEETLTQALRRPLKPLGQALRRRLAFVAAGLAGLVSKRYQSKLKASANKRNPRRYLGGGTGSTAPAAQLGLFGTSDLALYERQTKEISERFLPFGEEDRPVHLDLCSAEFVRARLKAAPSGTSALPDSEIGFSILTPYFSHERFFIDCARSVAAAAVQGGSVAQIA